MLRRRRPLGRCAERHAAPSQRRDRAVGRRGPPCLDVAVQQAAGPPGCSSPPRLDTTRPPCSTGERADLVLRPLLRRAPPPRRYGLGWPAFSSPPSTSKWSQRDRESDAGERGKRPRVSPGQLFCSGRKPREPSDSIGRLTVSRSYDPGRRALMGHFWPRASAQVALAQRVFFLYGFRC